VRFEIVPGGHLGMLTGRRARTSTWPIVDGWVDEWSTAAEDEAVQVPAEDDDGEAVEEPVIGANPNRRYRSAGSRALRR
jgi:polyhydroxyalkanoate synthase